MDARGKLEEEPFNLLGGMKLKVRASSSPECKWHSQSTSLKQVGSVAGMRWMFSETPLVEVSPNELRVKKLSAILVCCGTQHAEEPENLRNKICAGRASRTTETQTEVDEDVLLAGTGGPRLCQVRIHCTLRRVVKGLATTTSWRRGSRGLAWKPRRGMD